MGKQRRRRLSMLAIAMPTRWTSQKRIQEANTMPAVDAAACNSAGRTELSLPRSIKMSIMFSNVSSTRCQRRRSVA